MKKPESPKNDSGFSEKKFMKSAFLASFVLLLSIPSFASTYSCPSGSGTTKEGWKLENISATITFDHLGQGITGYTQLSYVINYPANFQPHRFLGTSSPIQLTSWAEGVGHTVDYQYGTDSDHANYKYYISYGGGSDATPPGNNVTIVREYDWFCNGPNQHYCKDIDVFDLACPMSILEN
jgi:hypothetical protein